MLSPPNLHFPGIFPATICWRWESDISMRYLVFSVFYLWPGPRPYITAHHWRQREAAEVAEVSFYSYLCSAVTRLRPDPEPRLSSGRVTWHAARYVTCHAVTQRRASGIIMVCRLKATSEVWSIWLEKRSLITPSANLDLRFYVTTCTMHHISVLVSSVCCTVTWHVTVTRHAGHSWSQGGDRNLWPAEERCSALDQEVWHRDNQRTPAQHRHRGNHGIECNSYFIYLLYT